ncbi:energy transducer TonB [Thermodesulfobacteriota bacterium]
MHPQAYWPPGIGNDSRTFLLFLALSSVCHVILFGMFIFVPSFEFTRKSTLSVINVSMVTLPARETAPELQLPTEKPTPPKVQASSITPKTVSVAPENKIKKSLKKETFRPSKMLKHTITRMEKEIEASRPDQVNQALDRIKDRVEKTGEFNHPNKKAVKGPAAVGGSEADSKRMLELIDIYRVEVAYQIQKNWAFSEQLAGGRTDLVAELAFTIMPNGEIRDIWFDKRSGNNYLDESAKKAILKSNPVRPHPPGIVKPLVTVGLRFTPKGVK